MPKLVDHQARRLLIADAVHRIIDAKGLDSVSLREVAAEAGISMGAVQHYFATKEEMLAVALQQLNARISVRVAATGESDPLRLVRAAMLEMLPLDETRRFEARIGLAFLARAAVADDLAELFRTGVPHVLGFFAGQLRAAQAAGRVAADLDPDEEAKVLFGVAQGVGQAALLGYYPPEAAAAAVDHHLARLTR
ncbi:TetR/AcrR family transcriptional regulator [Nonomuraea gerenzanensis]|uniref:Transcriptional regulator, TetR family n=1 Tax=Nonomuraea gerenzanensis TaxID=93944 RepID=A0A1M4E500_9ACTN|nr:TetR/AcrR family transcriptional regulator [Nonomuraea gerenzanensis]UBU16050.1 TetR/AcrR family transcriptional regulator [Nonomuraea gerenzanensis]SBO93852.1 Transcriptional regulator, TetR family [Nonomuraea gerenzanensis]